MDIFNLRPDNFSSYLYVLLCFNWSSLRRKSKETFLHDNQKKKKKKVCPICKIFFSFRKILTHIGFKWIQMWCIWFKSHFILKYLFIAQLGSYILAVDDFRLILDYLLVLVSFQAEVCHSPFSDFNFKRSSSTWLSRLFYSSNTTFSIPLGVVILCFFFSVIHQYRKKPHIA